MPRKSPKFSLPDDRAALKAIRQLCSKAGAPPDLLTTGSQSELDGDWLYDLGCALKEVVAEGDRSGMKRLAESLIDQKPPPKKVLDKLLNVLIKARALFQAYPTQSAFEKFSKGLEVTFILDLLGVRDTEQRDKLRKRCLNEGWSLRELQKEIRKVKGPPQSKGGRRYKPPEHTDLQIALWDLELLDERWRKSVELWFTKDGTVKTRPSQDDAKPLEAALAVVDAHVQGTDELRKVLAALARQAKATSKRS